MTAALKMLAHNMPIMTRLLFRYLCGPTASDGQPVYRAYVVKMLPRFPNPETRALAAATPTSPWRGWNISFVHVMQMGTVGPKPNPTMRSPPYRDHELVVVPANVVMSSPVI